MFKKFISFCAGNSCLFTEQQLKDHIQANSSIETSLFVSSLIYIYVNKNYRDVSEPLDINYLELHHGELEDDMSSLVYKPKSNTENKKVSMVILEKISDMSSSSIAVAGTEPTTMVQNPLKKAPNLFILFLI